ncbi:hypothetical protein NAI65_13780 [Francisella tularensis subsp. holarctica]|nr:hypothetical protein [Francisella tularensis subsp. holarctica]
METGSVNFSRARCQV